MDVSGRVPHAEKITVYLTPEEFVDLEELKLEMRREGIRVDRGRVVRAAIVAGIKDDETIKRLLKGDS